jgi:hypothetical protein
LNKTAALRIESGSEPQIKKRPAAHIRSGTPLSFQTVRIAIDPTTGIYNARPVPKNRYRLKSRGNKRYITLLPIANSGG